MIREGRLMEDGTNRGDKILQIKLNREMKKR